MRVTTTRAGIVRAAAGAGVVALLAASCGDSATESGLEELIENQAGGDVDVDLEDGEFRVQTSDGEFSIDVDGDDGSFSVEVDGDEVISGQSDEDGGQLVIDEDGDGEDQTVIENDIGDDGEGSFTIDGEEGEFSVDVGGAEIPDEWPDDVPEPTGITIESAATSSLGDQLTVTVNGTTDDGEGFIESYGSALNDAGIPQSGSFEQAGNLTVLHENSEWIVNAFAAPVDGVHQVSISIIPAQA